MIAARVPAGGVAVVYRIREMEPSQRPRERLLEHGPQVLSDAELLAVLIRTGKPGTDVVSAAHELLTDYDGLAGMAGKDVRELMSRSGFGPAKACTVAAALELGRRLARSELKRAERLDQPAAAGEFLARFLRGERCEVFGVLSLDSRHRFIKDHRLSQGTRDQAPVDPAELFRRALLDDAAEVLVFHNHPSGDLDPSRDDLALTRRLVDAGRAIGVALVDHLLVAECRWLSLRVSHPELFTTRSQGAK